MGELSYISTILELVTIWKLTSRLDVSTALPPAKETSVPIREETGWVPEPDWTFRRREKLLSLT
jgi:hypothetical protein